MTEERIKELAHTWAWKPIAASIAEHEENLSILIRTVAAEARKGGIEEFYAYLIKIHPASLEQIANLMNELLEKKNV